MGESAGKILVVDDEKRIRHLLTLYLEKEGYEVAEAEDGRQALNMLAIQSYDLILLDVMMPEMGGMEVMERVREESDIPIIMITAKGEESHRIEGFRLGADDYIVKPFSPREAILRIAAVLKRTKMAEKKAQVIEHPLLKILPESRLVLIEDTPINLTPKEFDLLLCLAQAPEKIFSREELLKEVWRYEFFGDLRTVDTHIKRLREKLSKRSLLVPKLIVTVWGMGYKFSPAELEIEEETDQ